MKPIIIILIVFGIQMNCFGQQDQFFEFNTARFSRIIGLGNAFTGLADDIESVYYNSAGIANLDYYAAIYSKGHGFALIIDDYKADDLAIILPVLKKLGIFALSVHRFSMLDNTHSENIYRLHFARFLFTNRFDSDTTTTVSSARTGAPEGAIKRGTGSAVRNTGGDYSGATDIKYTVIIDSVGAGAEVGSATFEWYKDGVVQATAVTTAGTARSSSLGTRGFRGISLLRTPPTR